MRRKDRLRSTKGLKLTKDCVLRCVCCIWSCACVCVVRRTCTYNLNIHHVNINLTITIIDSVHSQTWLCARNDSVVRATFLSLLIILTD